MNNKKQKIVYADDDYESIFMLLRLRAPSLAIGLILGIGISFVVSGFEKVLAHNVQVAFFLPFVIYIADAIGAQTGSIYARDLRSGKAKFSNYFHKELTLGIIFGVAFGAIAGGITWLWLDNDLLALSVGTATGLAIAIAPIMALSITQVFQFLHKDPAAGSGPIATVIQDMTSVVIYGLVSSMILLS